MNPRPDNQAEALPLLNAQNVNADRPEEETTYPLLTHSFLRNTTTAAIASTAATTVIGIFCPLPLMTSMGAWGGFCLFGTGAAAARAFCIDRRNTDNNAGPQQPNIGNNQAAAPVEGIQAPQYRRSSSVD